MDGHPHLRGPGSHQDPGQALQPRCQGLGRKPGSYPAELQRVCNWAELSDQQRTNILGRTPAGEIWGVGRRISAQAAEQGVLTALDLARLPAHAARDGWSVVLERTVREPARRQLHEPGDSPSRQKQIACTRSFGHPITTLPID